MNKPQRKCDMPQKSISTGNRVIKTILITLIIVACVLMIKPSYLYVKAVVAQVLLNHAWQQSQKEAQLHIGNEKEHKQLPWQWADSYPVAKLTYEKAQSSWIILAGMTGRAMAFAPTWLEDSAKANTYGNTVISAHNDSHFKSLEYTAVGDVFLLENVQGEQLNYRVNTIEIVPEHDISPYLFQDETMITLITCYPFEPSNEAKSKRLVIQAVNI